MRVHGAAQRILDLPIDYCLGKDLHLIIMTHRKEILAMGKTIDDIFKLNGLADVQDSVKLLTQLARQKKIIKVQPEKITYPDPKAPDARRPKRVELLPAEKQVMEIGGMYMFNVRTNTQKRILYLGIAVVLGFLILLWRVWPVWMRVGLWYISYYLAMALVSSLSH